MKLTHVNNLLLAAIVAVNGYIIAGPLIPQLQLSARGTNELAIQKLAERVHSRPGAQEAGKSNGVIIAGIMLDLPILEGPKRDMYEVLDKGIWRWPDGSTPDKGGNTVLLGHRFTYANPNGVLYHLDKVNAGDAIGVTWNNKRYVYTVRETKVVPPSDVSILEPTDEPTLTIYTCAPLWKPVNRLVVVATLKETL